jgi:DNA-binding NtrC family response regulator
MRLLEEFSGHRARVAELLGVSERTLYRKLKEL